MIKTSLISRSLLAAGAFASLGAGVGVAALASADTGTTASATSTTRADPGFKKNDAQRPAVMGTIASINGNSITVTTQDNTTYTVDLSSAKIIKGGAEGAKPTESTVSALAVGDKVSVRGTVSGTSVTATDLVAGQFGGSGMGMGMGNEQGDRGGRGTTGTVSAINGTTLTVTDEDGGTYTVDASAASFKKIGDKSTASTDSSISAVAVGDRVSVRGSVVTANLTAKEVMLGVPAHGTAPTAATAN